MAPGFAGAATAAGCAGFGKADGAAGFGKLAAGWVAGAMLAGTGTLAGAIGAAGGLAGRDGVITAGAGRGIAACLPTPTVTSLRKSLSVAGPIPGTFCRSSTDLKGPFCRR